ncbi:MAG: hypothetical protein PHE10_07655 [Kiritimatiellae bacterium]|nr:hypothetical protein [Kiritimatiellia bacterium]
MKRQRVFLIGLSAVWLALAAGLAAAAEYTWTGGGGDACWTNSANWGGAGYPDGDLDVALFTAAADVTLDSDVTLGRIHLNGGGATVTINGTNTITVGQNVDSAYKHVLSEHPADRLVICPKVVMKYGVSPNERLYGNLQVAYQGTVVFKNRVQINDHVYAFVFCNGTLEFSGDAAAGPSGTPGSAKLLMCMGGDERVGRDVPFDRPGIPESGGLRIER